MLADMFQDPDDAAVQEEEELHGALPSYIASRPGHCASDLDFPPQERQQSNFVGLLNQ